MDSKKENEVSDVARREEEILAFWNERDIFNKSLAKESPKGDFVFYDGPPFATGLPHYGHILTGTMKDAIPRFWTMNGYHVERKWGWDCHGLPIENIIEKKLGLTTKRDIEELGVKKFNETARDTVLEYADDWRKIVPRMGRWVDMEDDYKTMDASYTESVWHVFRELDKKGLVYEGFKAMHLCPRCGTTLSNFEVNQGYKDIKDIAVTVKMPLLDEAGNVTDTSILIWTTTPWTLPGNMAIAVHNDIEYVKVQVTMEDKKEMVILAKARLAQLGTDQYEVLETMKGSDLVGLSYLPPFDYIKNAYGAPVTEDSSDRRVKLLFKNAVFDKVWQIYHADYVEIGEEGTGAVHIAPAYGDDDLNLAEKNNLPIIHHVDSTGHFVESVTDFKGFLVKPKDDEASGVDHKDADIKILKKLQETGTVFRKENITHSYPHCWRCSTPLINYATTSWFVRVTDIKDKLVEENAKVNWVPEHVGRARFGKWLEGARDWAVSRQRYWGAPIPIWRNETTKSYKVLGSLADLKQYVRTSGNKYFLTRHGESEYNTHCTLNGVVGVANGLTEKGKAQIAEAVKVLAKEKIDIIYHSPLERTVETAKLIAEGIGLSPDALISDNRLMEMQFGEFEGKNVRDYYNFFGGGHNQLIKHPEGGETWTEVKRRAGEFLYEIERTHSGKRILIVSHNGVLEMLQGAAYGTDAERLAHIIDDDSYDMLNAEVRELPFVPLPHNDNYELDYHRPYIDEVELFDTDGTKLVRVPDVFDCWFESGSMPYAQNHYPFENLETFNAEKGISFPAQFIGEGLDQTRGWFYSLTVLGVALFGKAPFENVIVNGLTLAEDGKKMSKSLNNYPDPMDVAHRVGADALRYYLLSSPIVRGEDLSFREEEVEELQRKNIGRLHNVLAMYEMYADINVHASDTSSNVLDRWILARLNETVANATEGYTHYELDKATRPLESLIDDLSVWYLRRSRERLKQNSQNMPSASLRDPVVSSAVQESTSPSSTIPRLAPESHFASFGTEYNDKEACLATLRHVLQTLALVMAPVMPFYAEYLFLRVREEGDAESVHLMNWPSVGATDTAVLEQMRITREVVAQALEARSKANIKVRQPLRNLTIKNETLQSEFFSVIAEELNVKEVVCDPALPGAFELDTKITPELKREGDVRELMRAIQELRKTNGLNPHDRIILTVSDDTKALLAGFEAEVQGVVGAEEIRTNAETTNEITIDGQNFAFGVTKT